jgi:hypothetical protein
VSLDCPQSERFIWATRGRSWGFRFLLNAGLSDPLPDYERAFGDLRDAPTAWRREGRQVALRIPDPLGRKDAAGRIIPHEFVIFGDLADAVDSVEEGLRMIWPLVADAYASVWEAPDPPTASGLGFVAP